MSALAITVYERGSMIRSYFAYCRHLLLDPRDFFRQEYSRWAVTESLAFGLASAWIAVFCVFVMQSLTGLAAQEFFRNWFEHLLLGGETIESAALAKQFLGRSAWVLASPFVHLWYILAAAWLLYLFTRLLVPNSSGVSHKSMMKILGFSAVGLWFSVIPIFGGLLAYIVTIALTVVGVSEVYNVSMRWSLLIVVLPQVLFAMILTVLFLVLSLLLMLWLGTVLGQILEQQMVSPYPLPF